MTETRTGRNAVRPDDVFLGIDLGTSAVKTVLVDAAQRILATATVPLATSRPRPDWSEQDPEEWWRAVCRAIDSMRRNSADALRDVVAVGLSGQMHGLVLLDEDGSVLRPAILWNDSRASAEVLAISEANPEFAGIAGAAPSTSFWPAKLLWLRRHEPDLLARVRRMLLPKDYIRLKLTGLYQTDGCDAGGSLLLDEASRDWSEPILAACGVAVSQLPDLVEGDQPAGMLLAPVACSWGIAGSVVVAGGGGDSATGAIGIGAIRDGDAYISLGTSAQIFVTTSGYRPAVSAGVQAFAHALSGLWFQAAAVLNGASALAWAVRMLGHDDPAPLLAEAQAQYAGPGSLLFLPYLTGERSPHNDPFARGVLFGLSPATNSAQVIQSVIEGVAYSLADALQSLTQAGSELRAAAIVGGGARSKFWAQIIADVIGIPVVRYAGGETGPAFGAARLARLALTGEPADAVCTPPDILDRMIPDAARHRDYRRELTRFRALYQALKPEFRRN
jgi:xylulokinase